MSLYTFLASKRSNYDKQPEGLQVVESTNVALLSQLAEVPIDNIKDRLANNNKAYVAYVNDHPAAFGWVAEDEIQIGELGHRTSLPFGHKYLWNFRTQGQFRGYGIYPALLNYILKVNKYNTIRFWIIHAPENKASLRGIRKVGFDHVGKLFLDENNKAVVEHSELAKGLEKHLQQMDIQLSSQKSPSCWNCNSPFYKKRTNECCCAIAKQECNPRLENGVVTI